MADSASFHIGQRGSGVPPVIRADLDVATRRYTVKVFDLDGYTKHTIECSPEFLESMLVDLERTVRIGKGLIE